MAETDNGHSGRRFAIYFAPPAESPLFRFGSDILGRDVATGEELSRDARSGEALPQAAFDGISLERWREITSSPRMYGFHATLKPPFRLPAGRTPEELVARLEQFVSGREAFKAPPLRVARISNFLALVPHDDSTALRELANACVCDFDDFRAPPPAAELERRRRASLTPRQQALLEAWGYPYVLDEWRFHMTLASGLDHAEADHLRDVLEDLAAPVCGTPLLVDGVSLFEQPAADAPFRLAARFTFDGSEGRAV